MHREFKPFISYLVFFYSFLVALIICYIFLSILNIKPEPLSDFADALPIFYNNFVPQAYKMRAYPLAFGIIIAATLGQYLLINKLAQRNPRTIALLAVPFSLFSIVILPLLHRKIILVTLGHLEQFRSIFTLSPIIFSPPHIIFFIFGFLCLVVIYFFYNEIQTRLSKINKRVLRFIPVLAIILIVVTLFDRRFEEKLLFVGPIAQYVHTIPLIAPIQDVLMGKILLVNADSQYGLFLIYLNTLIFKFIPLTFTNFFYLMMVYGILYYLAAFAFLRLRLKSNLWALWGLISLFTLHFYAVFDRYTRPMTFPMRYLLDLPFFLILLKVTNTKRNWIRHILPIYLAISFYYNYESGIAEIAAYFFYLFLTFATDKNYSTIRAKVLSLILKMGETLTWIISIGLLYSIYAKRATGYFPDWQNTLFYIRIHSQGMDGGGAPPQVGLHLYAWAVYFIVLVRSLIACIQKRIENIRLLDATVALYGFIISIYFIKSPYILNLAVTSVPAIILSVILFKDLFEFAVVGREHKLLSVAGLTFFSPFVVLGSIFVFSLTFYIGRVSVNPLYDYWKNESSRVASAKFYDEASLSATALTKYEKDKKEVTLLSFYDGFLRLKAKKLNSLRLTNLQMILTNSQAEMLFGQLKKINPEYVYTDSDDLVISVHPAYLRRFIFPQIFDFLSSNYHKIDTIGFLDVWQKNAT